MEKHIDSQEYHENNLWGYKFVFICNFNPSRIRREGGCQPPLPLLLREKTFVTPVKIKNFRWNFAGVHQIYRNTFWKKCILWWRHCWLWNFCEAKVDQTIDIFSDLKSIELTISPEVHLEKRWKSEWFQVGYLSSLYFKHWSLNFKRSLVYWILQLILNLDQRFLKRKTTDCH